MKNLLYLLALAILYTTGVYAGYVMGWNAQQGCIDSMGMGSK